MDPVARRPADGLGNRSRTRLGDDSRKVDSPAKKRSNKTFETQKQTGSAVRPEALAVEQDAAAIESGAIPIRFGERSGEREAREAAGVLADVADSAGPSSSSNQSKPVPLCPAAVRRRERNSSQSSAG